MSEDRKIVVPALIRDDGALYPPARSSPSPTCLPRVM